MTTGALRALLRTTASRQGWDAWIMPSLIEEGKYEVHHWHMTDKPPPLTIETAIFLCQRIIWITDYADSLNI